MIAGQAVSWTTLGKLKMCFFSHLSSQESFLTDAVTQFVTAIRVSYQIIITVSSWMQRYKDAVSII